MAEAKAYDGLTTADNWASATSSAADLYTSTYTYDENGNIKTAVRHNDAGDVYDDLCYKYQHDGGGLMRNRLYELKDAAPGGSGDPNVVDLPTVSPTFTDPDGTGNAINTSNNYGYDQLGELVRDTREEIASIDWTVTGKVAAVHRTLGSTKPELEFHYGADGQRISKTVGDADVDGHREYYVRDAQGNIMAIYRYAPGTFQVTERPIYGSDRVGSYAKAYELMGVGLLPFPYIQFMSTLKEQFELKDHLGNVATVITGRLLSGNGTGSQRQAEVLSAQGYEPFGSILPTRNYSSSAYRFGFQGQEKDDEISEVGTSYSFEYRILDTRIGKFLSIDPLHLKYPYYSPYSFSGNRLIDAKELEGLEPGLIFGSTKQVNSVNGTANNSNYVAFPLLTMNGAKLEIMNHRALGNEIKTVYLQLHGVMGGEIALGEGEDKVLDTKASRLNEPHSSDDVKIFTADVEHYMKVQPFVSGEMNGPLPEEDQAFATSDEYKAVDAFNQLAQETDCDATIILGSCFIAADQHWKEMGLDMDGSSLMSALSKLTGRTIMANADYTSELNPATGMFLDCGRTSDESFKRGWSQASPSGDVDKTGGNLQLNSSGKPYEIKHK